MDASGAPSESPSSPSSTAATERPERPQSATRRPSRRLSSERVRTSPSDPAEGVPSASTSDVNAQLSSDSNRKLPTAAFPANRQSPNSILGKSKSEGGQSNGAQTVQVGTDVVSPADAGGGICTRQNSAPSALPTQTVASGGQFFHLTGCGTTIFNGVYKQFGMKSDKARYYKIDADGKKFNGPKECEICYELVGWTAVAPVIGPYAYYCKSDDKSPPAGGWSLGLMGSRPAPEGQYRSTM